MALWQFVFDLIPSSAATINGMVAARMSRDQLDAIELGFSEPAAGAIFERVGMMLPEIRSWGRGLRIYGNEDADDVKISFEGTTIEEVQFRLNVTDLSSALIGDVCAFARELNCVFATRSGAIIRPYSAALVRAITQSDAARFVSDPERYLREIAQRDSELE